eukprot:1744705-Rhodomonas_salina.1
MEESSSSANGYPGTDTNWPAHRGFMNARAEAEEQELRIWVKETGGRSRDTQGIASLVPVPVPKLGPTYLPKR